MAQFVEQDRTGLFSVIGAPYVAEAHRDARGHYHLDAIGGTTGVLVAGVWLTLYALMIAVAVVGKGGVGPAVETVTAALAQF